MSSSNTKYISIVPENGEQFNPSQKIIYNIEPNLGYIKKDTYLIFDVRNTSTNFAMIAFPNSVGAHALIDNIRIYSKMTGVLLEALENYSQIQGLINQYGYDDKTQLQLKEGVGEPCLSQFSLSNGSTAGQGTTANNITNLQLSPLGDNPNPATPKYVSRRFCIPLRAGLFRTFDSEKLIPILNMGGLRIEINLNPVALGCVRLMGAQRGAVGLINPYDIAQVDWVNGGKQLIARGGAGNTIVLVGTYDYKELGLCLGNSIRVWDVGVLNETRVITGIASAGGTITITFSGGNIAATSGNARVYVSQGIAGNAEGQGNAQNTPSIDALNYVITNTEMRICQVVPTPEQAKVLSSELKYEFTSYDVFLDNIDGGTLRHQVPVNSVSSKALGILSIPYRADEERNEAVPSYYGGIVPTNSALNSVQFFINNKLYPLRNYNPNVLNDRVICLNETVKTLKAIGISPKMLGLNQHSNNENYSNLFVVSRELARNGFVFDLRNAEAEVRLGFSAPRTFRTRVNTFVFSKKVIETTASGIQVVL